MNEIKTTIISEYINYGLSRNKKIVALQGGTRSGKTYNVMIWIILDCYYNGKRGDVYSVIRKTRTALWGSALRDFKNIMNDMGIYDRALWNETKGIYTFNNGAELEFVGADDEQKIRGRKRKIGFLNEFNELNFEDFTQIALRTTKLLIADYNPSISDEHWIVEEVLTRDDCALFLTTFKDNPYLDKSTIDEILKLKKHATLWKIFGEGKRATASGLIYPSVNIVSDIPPDFKLQCYGLDFGYSPDPVALSGIYTRGDDDVLFDEIIYQTELSASEIVALMGSHGIKKHYDEIFADHDKRSVNDIQKAGFNIKKAFKGKDSVEHGIITLNKKNIYITKRSVNMIKEKNNYCYITDSAGKSTGKPVDAFNHLWDANRYGYMTKFHGSAKSKLEVI
jgi:phage terminase large subunit